MSILQPPRRFESCVLATLAVLGGWLVVIAPGTAASVVPAGYAVARFEIERWRGDARPYAGPLSHSQWFSVAVLIVVTAFGDRVVGAAGLTVITLLLIARVHRLAPPIALSSPVALAAFDRAANQALAGAVARVGAIVIEPEAAGGVQVGPGGSSLSRNAARALSEVIGRPSTRRVT